MLRLEVIVPQQTECLLHLTGLRHHSLTTHVHCEDHSLLQCKGNTNFLKHFPLKAVTETRHQQRQTHNLTNHNQ
jgi:hypothetical protein